MKNKQHTQYFLYGWIAIAIGVFAFLLFLLDYHHHFIITTYKDVSDLNSIIACSTGICFSFASLLFILDNLETQRLTIEQQKESINQQKISIDLQREELKNQIVEMKESNTYFNQQTETLKLQTTESSFFQLLENHRSLVNSLMFQDMGYSGLDKFYKMIKSDSILYYQAAVTGKVIKADYSRLYPIRRLSLQLENIEQIYNNVRHLIKLIAVKLDNNPFYHETLYNSLSKAEKYLLGLYVENEARESLEIFQNKIFNYLAFFQGSGNAYYNKFQIPFFPDVSIVFEKPRCEFYFNIISDTVSEEIGNIIIYLANNEGKQIPKLKSTRIEYDWYKKNYMQEYQWDITLNDKIKINMYDAIEKHIFPILQKLEKQIVQEKHPAKILFTIVFSFEYSAKSFEYTKQYEVDTYNANEEYCTISISERNNY